MAPSLRLVLALVLGLVLGAALTRSQGIPYRWQMLPPTVVYDMDGHALPGPIFATTIRDAQNPDTCVMLIRDVRSGETWPMGAVDAKSCILGGK